MKAYKIAVPESAEIPGVVGFSSDPDYTRKVTRQGIHELVKSHAEKLGYTADRLGNDSDYLLLWPDGDITTWHGKDIDQSVLNNTKWVEISPFDFLKLTPDDINDGTPINLAQNTVENIQTISTTDRNEKAWEIYKILINNHQLDAEIYKLEKAYNTQIGTEFYSKLAFVMADEFLKQAGNK